MKNFAIMTRWRHVFKLALLGEIRHLEIFGNVVLMNIAKINAIAVVKGSRIGVDVLHGVQNLNVEERKPGKIFTKILI